MSGRMISFSLILLTALFGTQTALADTIPAIEISEINYNAPGSDTDQEWVELHNFGNTALDIVQGSGAGSWRFSDGTNHTLTLSQGSLTINPGEYIILSVNPTVFLEEHAGYTGTIFKVAMSLSNSAASLALSNDKGSSWFITQNYTSSMGGNGDGKTLEWHTDHYEPSMLAGGTPGSASTIPSPDPLPTPSPTQSTIDPPATPRDDVPEPPIEQIPTVPPIRHALIITQVFYNPVGTDTRNEWVEVQNQGSITEEIHDGGAADAWRLRTNGSNHLLKLTNPTTSLQPGDRLIITNGPDSYLQLHPNFSGLIATASFSLTNTGATIAISPDGGESWSDVYSYTPADGGNGDDRALTKSTDGSWQTSPIKDAPIDPPKQLLISEVALAKETKNQFVTIHNNDDQPINLGDWKIVRTRATSKSTFELPNTTLDPGQSKRIYESELHFTVSLTPAGLSLLDPAGRVTDQITLAVSDLDYLIIHNPGEGSRWQALSSTDQAPSENTEIDNAQLVSLFDQPTTVQGIVQKSSGKSADILTNSQGLLHVIFSVTPGTKPTIHADDFITVTGRLESILPPVLRVTNADLILVRTKPKISTKKSSIVLPKSSLGTQLSVLSQNIVAIAPLPPPNLGPPTWTKWLPSASMGTLAFLIITGLIAGARRNYAKL